MQRPDDAVRVSPVTRVLVAAALVGGITAAVVAFFGAPEAAPATTGSSGEQGRAEVFAIRALAAAGLYETRGDYYSYSREATRVGSDWRLGFSRMFCGRFGIVQTCRPVRAGDGEDAWLTVGLDDDTWRVREVEGDFDDAPTATLKAFSRPDVRGAPHWEYPAASIRPAEEEGGRVSYEAHSLWVGPIPYKGPGSACEARAYLDGRVVYTSEHQWYDAAPHPTHSRTGGTRSGSLEGVAEADRAEIVCEQFDGAGWQVTGEPSVLQFDAEDSVTIEADVVWRGEPLVMGQSWCTVGIYDGDGALLDTRTTASRLIWPESQLDHPPIRATESFSFRVAPGDEVESATVDCVPN